MTSRPDLQQWIRSALVAAAVAGCQSADPRDPAATEDIEAALAALPEARVLLAAGDGVPQYIVGELGTIAAAHGTGLPGDDRALRPALPPILAALRLSSEALVLRKVSTDERGARHFRYDQQRDGLDVIGGDLVVHVDAEGVIFGINGTARGDLAPAPGALELAEGAASLVIANDARWAGLAGRAITGSRLVYLQTPEGALHRAHEQIVEGARGAEPVRDKVYVDAMRGEILAVHPLIHDGLDRRIYTDSTLVRVEGQAPTGDLDVDAAYGHLGTSYRAYNHFWSRDSYDGAGAPLVAEVHYSTSYCNAFWDGLNAELVLGDGDPAQGCGPLARSLDVIAHELTHAVTQHESNLTYSGEPGGLNESYSDIFATLTEAYGDGGSTGTLAINSQTFLIGDEVFSPFLRSMCDPAADGASHDVWSAGIGASDVHYSSGPNNLAFCLLTKGGAHPRGKTTVNVPAIGMEKAARIFYKANTDLLTSSSNYAAMRTAAIQAAVQLGYDQATRDAVACAYAAIAVGAAPASCGGTTPGLDFGIALHQASTTSLWIVGPGGPGDTGLGMAPGTSPSLARLAGGGYQVAFQARSGRLWTAGAAGTGDLGFGMAAATSPSITALPGGGYQIAFQANTGALWHTGSAGTTNTGLGMAAGTSPSIAALTTGGFQIAFQANTGALWHTGSAGTVNTGLGMAAGTSPSIAALATGGYQLAFQANTGALWHTGSAGTAGTALAMAAGTSPSITGLASSGYQIAFQASTGALAHTGSAGTANTGLGMAADASPSIAARSTGGFDLVFRANSGSLWRAGASGTGDLGLPVAASTGPAVR